MYINADLLFCLIDGPMRTDRGAVHTLWIETPWRSGLGSTYEDILYTTHKQNTAHTPGLLMALTSSGGDVTRRTNTGDKAVEK